MHIRGNSSPNIYIKKVAPNRAFGWNSSVDMAGVGNGATGSTGSFGIQGTNIA